MVIVQFGGCVSAMSDEPFALSKIPPALPAEGDYDAIRSAVMQSVRGRWFLEEYAKRNRQSDTLAVLAAIARIEAMIRGERNQHAYQTVRADLLDMAKTIAQTRAEVAGADSAAAEHAQGAGGDPRAAPGARPDIFASAERIQEVACTMRERGIDAQTCGQIEGLAASILAASSLRDPGSQRAQQLADVLRHLERRIDTMLASSAEVAAAMQPDELPVPHEVAAGAAQTPPSDPDEGDPPAVIALHDQSRRDPQPFRHHPETPQQESATVATASEPAAAPPNTGGELRDATLAHAAEPATGGGCHCRART